MTTIDTGADLPIEELREKYRIERDKRMGGGGLAQYRVPGEVDEEFDRDPYVEPGFTRDPIVEETEAVVVGGGFGGMLAGINLTKLGITDFRIIEKAGDFGGTWYWNRYPGAACDVESYVYLPLLEETGYMPTEKYAKAPEIFAYCQLLGRTFDLYRAALFQTEVVSAEWSDDTQRWLVTTTRGDKLSSRFFVIAGGILSKAKLPGINGIETFAGKAFHTSRWDYDYTGGSAFEPMVKLADKRVGIIGTGATAVQVVPKLAESAKEVYVFQRTPSTVGWRGNKPTDEDWFKSLEPGWQWERVENFTNAVMGQQPEVDLVQDAWTEMMWTDVKKAPESPEEAEALERIDFANMEGIRRRIADLVEDPETAEKLKPWYGQWCKRPCFHDEYLPSFNRPNVHLVDTDGRGVERITENGPVVDGVEYPLDLLIYASGFEVTTDYDHRLGFDPKGHDGLALSEAWSDGPHTLHGVLAHGFPNMLMISTVQGGWGTNFVHYLSETSRHVAEIIARCERDDIATIEATTEAEEEWLMVLYGTVAGVAAYNATCTPGYMNSEQSQNEKSARNLAYLGSIIDYAQHLKRWRAEGGDAGVELTPRAG
jgi:cation diffusion facilitator CzcD-associated flavoprotein CzcO